MVSISFTRRFGRVFLRDLPFAQTQNPIRPTSCSFHLADCLVSMMPAFPHNPHSEISNPISSRNPVVLNSSLISSFFILLCLSNQDKVLVWYKLHNQSAQIQPLLSLKWDLSLGLKRFPIWHETTIQQFSTFHCPL